jgi:Spx/MgsR family transcriptional regulator
MPKNMLKIYGIPNCNTMKKTFDFLNEKGISYEFHDYKKKGIQEEVLNSFLAALGADVVLNKQGSTYKQLDDTTKTSIQNSANLKQFLQEKPSAIKRPILEQNGSYLAGFDVEKLSAFLSL